MVEQIQVSYDEVLQENDVSVAMNERIGKSLEESLTAVTLDETEFDGNRSIAFDIKRLEWFDDSDGSASALDSIKVIRLLGEGVFGQVFLVSVKGSSKAFALKKQSKFELFDHQKVENAITERRLMASMKHPFIVPFVNSFQDRHFLYLMLEFIPGGELWSLMHPSNDLARAESVVFPEDQARFYAFALADTLQYIHSRKCAYRDLKPENVLLDASGYPVLVDFGLAKCLKEKEKTYTMAGTPSYCSPEILNGSGHDRNTDWWSLGIICYEMRLGHNPFDFEGIDQIELYRSIVEDDPETSPVDSSNENEISFIASLLHKDPNQRLGGIGNILDHPWLSPLSLEEMRSRSVEAPWIPSIKTSFDATHFEAWHDGDEKAYPYVGDETSALFDDY